MVGCKTAAAVPDLDVKAYNSRVITAWLAECFAAFQPVVPDRSHDQMPAAIWRLASLYQNVEESPRYLSQDQAERIYRSGMIAIQSYSALNVASVANRRVRWIVRPKIHKTHPMLRDLRRTRLTLRFWKKCKHPARVFLYFLTCCCLPAVIKATTGGSFIVSWKRTC